MTQERILPKKIRVTKLQEAQLLELQNIEASCAQMFYDIGYDAGSINPRVEAELARLTKSHDILVAEADHQPAGLLVWADQAPGVAWIPTIEVAPDYQRFGIATRLLRDFGEAAHGLGIEVAVTPCWERASWAMAFLGVRGFELLDSAALPAKLATWKANMPADLVAPGQKLWWAKTDGLGTIPGLPRPH